MITIYAKSLSGDVIPVSITSCYDCHDIYPTLASIVCSDDPSRLVILPDIELNELNDGDSISYYINDPLPFYIGFSKYNTYLFDYMDNEIKYYNISIDIIESSSQDIIFQYDFLFSFLLEEGTLASEMFKSDSFIDNLYQSSFIFHFIRQSDFSIENDDQETFVNIKRNATRYTSLYQMIETDENIPSRFRSSIYRSVYRKWSSTLKTMARPISRFIRNKIMNSSLKNSRFKIYQEIIRERKIFKAIYRQFRFTPPPYPRQDQ